MKLSERMEKMIRLSVNGFDEDFVKGGELSHVMTEWLKEVEELEKSSNKSMVVDYSKPDVPKGYVCSVCGATGCKMWKKFGYKEHDHSLLCSRCAAEKEGIKLGSISERGEVGTTYGLVSEIGAYRPAVPHDEEFCHFNYLTLNSKSWWQRLPTVKK